MTTAVVSGPAPKDPRAKSPWAPGWIEEWNPEDERFWNERGAKIATKNLWVSIPSLCLSFIVWMMWSAIVVNLNNIGFAFTSAQLFTLTAVPGLAGATLRIFHSFLVGIFGGRNGTIFTTAALLVPWLGLGFALRDTTTTFTTFVIIGALCGFGGGNFASSMSNISTFYPRRKQGAALGLNAALGNLGVSIVQFVIPIVIGAAVLSSLGGDSLAWNAGKFDETGRWIVTSAQPVKQMWLQNAALVWVPPIVLTLLAAIFLMNNLRAATASLSDTLPIFHMKHTWIMTWLYTMTFGSFIGFSAAFPLTIKVIFGNLPDAPEGLALKFAFLGPLVGSIARAVGGYASDKWGGARVTFWNTLVMVASAYGVTFFTSPRDMSTFPMFMGLFLLLFITTGVGNASTFRMIGVIRQFTLATRGPVLGWTSAVAAYGAFVIPMVFKSSIEKTASPNPAIYAFIAYYFVSAGLCWWFYMRRSAEEYGA